MNIATRIATTVNAHAYCQTTSSYFKGEAHFPCGITIPDFDKYPSATAIYNQHLAIALSETFELLLDENLATLEQRFTGLKQAAVAKYGDTDWDGTPAPVASWHNAARIVQEMRARD